VTKQETLRKMRELGLMEARALQTDAAGNAITETQIIGREEAAPRFDPSKDFQFTDVFKRADNAMYENKRRMKSDKSSGDIY
jgi:hypothetical protein